jgi:hypothetical protein
MSQPTFAEYAEASRAAGYDETLERAWAPNAVQDMHTHPFAVQALVTQGDFVLTCEGQAPRHLKVGDSFSMDSNVRHSEHYGAQGATYWAARRNPR